jgi:hypothetical protein
VRVDNTGTVVVAGSVQCAGPVRLAHLGHFLFVRLRAGPLVVYDLFGDTLPTAPVWTFELGRRGGGVAVVLQGRVLLVTRLDLRELLPVDLCASKPADWKRGAA